MKKSLIALAALAAVTAASAQSTVTLSGNYSFSYQTDLTNVAANSTLLTVNSANTGTAAAAATNIDGQGFTVTAADFKLTAVEDLGGGLKASFDYTIESGSNFRGTPMTRADSGIGVSTPMGSVAMRNTRHSDLLASIASPAISLPDSLYDGLGILSRSGIDTVSYTAPTISGFTASVTYAEGNDGAIDVPTVAATAKSASILGVNYANGPISVTYAMKAASLNAGSTLKKNQNELAATYDFGVAKVGFAFDDKTTTAATSKTATGYSITVPVGAITFGAQMFKRGVLKQTDFGASYAFSKRTSVSVAAGKLSGNTTAEQNGNQSRVRLLHTF
jgi:predicted porin